MYQLVTQFINRSLSSLSPLQVIGATIGTQLLYKAYHHNWRDTKEDLQDTLFYLLQNTPMVKGYFAKQLAKDYEPQLDSADYSIHKTRTLRYKTLPDEGLPQEKVLKMVEEICDDKKVGIQSGNIYRGKKRNLGELNGEISKIAGYINPLHPGVFSDVRQAENEVIAWCAKLMHGDENTMGTINAGGTLSIYESVLAHRKWAEKEKGLKHKTPCMVIPKTAHAAFARAAEYFKIKLIEVDCDPITHKVKIEDVRKAAKKHKNNIMMIVGSAPNYQNGVMDDLKALSDIATKYNCGLHVDGCLGGFLIPFMKKAGFDLPLFDFRLPGVTAITMDSHKYGYVHKGSSVALFRKKVGLYQADFRPNWKGGLYLTPSLPGSRPGDSILKTWGTMLKMGLSGYVEATKGIILLTQQFKGILKSIPELEILGDPQISVVAFKFKDPKYNIYLLNEKMKERGWDLNGLQDPASLHICVTDLMTELDEVTEKFHDDLLWCIDYIKKHPHEKPKGDGATYGAMQKIPQAIAPQFLEMLGREYNFLDNRIEPTRDKAIQKLQAKVM